MNYIFSMNTLFCNAFVLETNVKNSKALHIGKSRRIAGNFRSIIRNVLSRTVLDRVLIFLTTEIYNIRLYCILNNVVYKYYTINIYSNRVEILQL